MNKLISEIEKWASKYQFSFQFWGEGNNNVFIEKDGVELHSSGNYSTPQKAMRAALSYIQKINPQ